MSKASTEAENGSISIALYQQTQKYNEYKLPDGRTITNPYWEFIFILKSTVKMIEIHNSTWTVNSEDNLGYVESLLSAKNTIKSFASALSEAANSISPTPP